MNSFSLTADNLKKLLITTNEIIDISELRGGELGDKLKSILRNPNNPNLIRKGFDRFIDYILIKGSISVESVNDIRSCNERVLVKNTNCADLALISASYLSPYKMIYSFEVLTFNSDSSNGNYSSFSVTRREHGLRDELPLSFKRDKTNNNYDIEIKFNNPDNKLSLKVNDEPEFYTFKMKIE